MLSPRDVGVITDVAVRGVTIVMHYYTNMPILMFLNEIEMYRAGGALTYPIDLADSDRTVYVNINDIITVEEIYYIEESSNSSEEKQGEDNEQ